jgi:hypothetical protein
LAWRPRSDVPMRPLTLVIWPDTDVDNPDTDVDKPDTDVDSDDVAVLTTEIWPETDADMAAAARPAIAMLVEASVAIELVLRLAVAAAWMAP